jgi:hypothetical protein
MIILKILETPTARRLRVLPSIDHPLIQYDYAGQHTFARTAETLCLNFTVLDPPTYSPALAPSDFHIFPKLKELKVTSVDVGHLRQDRCEVVIRSLKRTQT